MYWCSGSLCWLYHGYNSYLNSKIVPFFFFSFYWGELHCFQFAIRSKFVYPGLGNFEFLCLFDHFLTNVKLHLNSIKKHERWQDWRPDVQAAFICLMLLELPQIVSVCVCVCVFKRALFLRCACQSMWGIQVHYSSRGGLELFNSPSWGMAEVLLIHFSVSILQLTK